MKKTQAVKKLTLSKETLVNLNGADLGKVAGGSGWSCDSICPSVEHHLPLRVNSEAAGRLRAGAPPPVSSQNAASTRSGKSAGSALRDLGSAESCPPRLKTLLACPGARGAGS